MLLNYGHAKFGPNELVSFVFAVPPRYQMGGIRGYQQAIPIVQYGHFYFDNQ